MADISTSKAVPGDEMKFTAAHGIVATGEPSGRPDGHRLRRDGPLAAAITSTVSKTIEGDPIGPITEDDNGKTNEVIVDFDFPTATNSSQNGTLDLSDVVITLTQTDTTPAVRTREPS